MLAVHELWVDVAGGRAGVGDRVLDLTPREVAVLAVLLEAEGRVVSRRQIALRAGMRELSERRCDALLVGLRRVLGPDAIRTVRGRGWALPR